MSVEQPGGEVQAHAAQPIGTGQPPISAQEQQASVGAVAAPGSSQELTMDQGPPEYSEVVKQMPQGMVPVQQPVPQGMVPVQYVQQHPGPVQQPGQQGIGPLQQPLPQGMVPVQYVQQQPGQPSQQGLPQQPQFVYFAQQPLGPSGGTQQPPIQPVPYMVQAPIQPVMATPRPPYSGPHDFIIFTVMVAIACGLLNLTSLFCGVPAVVFAVMSRFQKEKYQANFANAKNYGSGAVILTVACIVWTLSMACLMIGLIIWDYFNPASGYCSYTYSSYGGYTYSC